jgi:hypothetical protein
VAWEGVGDSVARLPAARPLAKAAANVCLLPSPPAHEAAYVVESRSDETQPVGLCLVRYNINHPICQDIHFRCRHAQPWFVFWMQHCRHCRVSHTKTTVHVMESVVRTQKWASDWTKINIAAAVCSRNKGPVPLEGPGHWGVCVFVCSCDTRARDPDRSCKQRSVRSSPAAEHGLSGGAVPSTSMGDIPSGVGGGKRGAAPESMLPPGR